MPQYDVWGKPVEIESLNTDVAVAAREARKALADDERGLLGRAALTVGVAAAVVAPSSRALAQPNDGGGGDLQQGIVLMGDSLTVGSGAMTEDIIEAYGHDVEVDAEESRTFDWAVGRIQSNAVDLGAVDVVAGAFGRNEASSSDVLHGAESFVEAVSRATETTDHVKPVIVLFEVTKDDKLSTQDWRSRNDALRAVADLHTNVLFVERDELPYSDDLARDGVHYTMNGYRKRALDDSRNLLKIANDRAANAVMQVDHPPVIDEPMARPVLQINSTGQSSSSTTVQQVLETGSSNNDGESLKPKLPVAFYIAPPPKVSTRTQITRPETPLVISPPLVKPVISSVASSVNVDPPSTPQVGRSQPERRTVFAPAESERMLTEGQVVDGSTPMSTPAMPPDLVPDTTGELSADKAEVMPYSEADVESARKIVDLMNQFDTLDMTDEGRLVQYAGTFVDEEQVPKLIITQGFGDIRDVGNGEYGQGNIDFRAVDAAGNKVNNPRVLSQIFAVVEHEWTDGEGNKVFTRAGIDPETGNPTKIYATHLDHFTAPAGTFVRPGDELGILGVKGETRGIHFSMGVTSRDFSNNEYITSAESEGQIILDYMRGVDTSHLPSATDDPGEIYEPTIGDEFKHITLPEQFFAEYGVPEYINPEIIKYVRELDDDVSVMSGAVDVVSPATSFTLRIAPVPVVVDEQGSIDDVVIDMPDTSQITDSTIGQEFTPQLNTVPDLVLSNSEESATNSDADDGQLQSLEDVVDVDPDPLPSEGQEDGIEPQGEVAQPSQVATPQEKPVPESYADFEKIIRASHNALMFEDIDFHQLVYVDDNFAIHAEKLRDLMRTRHDIFPKAGDLSPSAMIPEGNYIWMGDPRFQELFTWDHDIAGPNEQFVSEDTAVFMIVLALFHKEMGWDPPEYHDGASKHIEHLHGGDIDFGLLKDPAHRKIQMEFIVSLLRPGGAVYLNHIVTGEQWLEQVGDERVRSRQQTDPNVITQEDHGSSESNPGAHIHASIDKTSTNPGPHAEPQHNVPLSRNGNHPERVPVFDHFNVEDWIAQQLAAYVPPDPPAQQQPAEDDSIPESQLTHEQLLQKDKYYFVPEPWRTFARQADEMNPSTENSLAATVLFVENRHWPDSNKKWAVSNAGALGPLQFLPSTWNEYGIDANGDGVADPNNPADAFVAAGRHQNMPNSLGDPIALAGLDTCDPTLDIHTAVFDKRSETLLARVAAYNGDGNTVQQATLSQLASVRRQNNDYIRMGAALLLTDNRFGIRLHNNGPGYSWIETNATDENGAPRVVSEEFVRATIGQGSYCD